MNSVIQTAADFWSTGRKIKRTPAGWISGNAVCCVANGERQDRRGRGGIKLNSDKITYSCFNCGFSTGYHEGGVIGAKFKQWLRWMGASEELIGKLTLDALKYRQNSLDQAAEQILTPEQIVEFPTNSLLLADNVSEFSDHVTYLKNRGFAPNDYPFYVSTSSKNFMRERVIVPLLKDYQVVGYSARAITNRLPKYYVDVRVPVLFGLELQKYEWSWVPVCEGIFDALSIDGVASLGNQINDSQAEQLQNLNKEIIVVPDNDLPGNRLIQCALDYGWGVSFPDWPVGVKDVNDAVLRWGKLFVLRHIWRSTIRTKTAIRIRQKFKNNE